MAEPPKTLPADFNFAEAPQTLPANFFEDQPPQVRKPTYYWRRGMTEPAVGDPSALTEEQKRNQPRVSAIRNVAAPIRTWAREVEAAPWWVEMMRPIPVIGSTLVHAARHVAPPPEELPAPGTMTPGRELAGTAADVGSAALKVSTPFIAGGIVGGGLRAATAGRLLPYLGRAAASIGGGTAVGMGAEELSERAKLAPEYGRLLGITTGLAAGLVPWMLPGRRIVRPIEAVAPREIPRVEPPTEAPTPRAVAPAPEVPRVTPPTTSMAEQFPVTFAKPKGPEVPGIDTSPMAISGDEPLAVARRAMAIAEPTPEAPQVTPPTRRIPTIKSLHAEGARRGMTHDDLHNIATDLGLKSLSDASPEQLGTIRQRMIDRTSAAEVPSAPKGKSLLSQTASRLFELQEKKSTVGLSPEEATEYNGVVDRFKDLRRQRGSIRFGRQEETHRAIERQIEADETESRAHNLLQEDLRERVARNEDPTTWPPFMRSYYVTHQNEILRMDQPVNALKGLLHQFEGTFMSVDQQLDRNTWTKPIADIIRNADVEAAWRYVEALDRSAAAFRKDPTSLLPRFTISRKNNDALYAYMNGETGTYSPEVTRIGTGLRAVLDDIIAFAQERGVASMEGYPIQRIEDYFTRVVRRESLPKEIYDALMHQTKGIFARLIGESRVGAAAETTPVEIPRMEEQLREARTKLKAVPPEDRTARMQAAKELQVAREALAEAKSGIYSQTRAVARTPFAEQRIGELQNVETWVPTVVRTYLKSMIRAAVDGPAVRQANELIERLPPGPWKEQAKWYVRNYLGLEDGLFRGELDRADRALASIGARSVLFGSRRLQLLHLGRFLTHIIPEAGFKDSLLGLADHMINVAKAIGDGDLSPARVWPNSRRAGFIPQHTEPPIFKTTGRPLKTTITWADILGNFLDFGNSEVKEAGFDAAIRGRKRLGDPNWWINAANDLRRWEGIPGRASPIKVMEFLPRHLTQFKYWLLKYGEKQARSMIAAISEPTKENLSREGRYLLMAGLAIGISSFLGIHLWHLALNTLWKAPGSVPLDTEIKAGKHLVHGDFLEATQEAARFGIPAGKMFRGMTATPPYIDLSGGIFASEDRPVRPSGWKAPVVKPPRLPRVR